MKLARWQLWHVVQKKPSSRLAAVTQPFTYGMFMVQHHTGMGTLQQGEHLNSMRHIREDIMATAYASYIMELVERVVEEGKSEPFAFEVLLQALQAIEDGYDPEAITLFVEWKMLPYTGVQPILHACASCGAVDGEFAFSFAQGGFVSPLLSARSIYYPFNTYTAKAYTNVL